MDGCMSPTGLTHGLVAAIDRRCARERLLGRTGEKSSVVESALAEYLTKELDEIDDELL